MKTFQSWQKKQNNNSNKKPTKKNKKKSCFSSLEFGVQVDSILWKSKGHNMTCNVWGVLLWLWNINERKETGKQLPQQLSCSFVYQLDIRHWMYFIISAELEEAEIKQDFGYFLRQRKQLCFPDPFDNPTLTPGSPVIGWILLQKHTHVVGEFHNISQIHKGVFGFTWNVPLNFSPTSNLIREIFLQFTQTNQNTLLPQMRDVGNFYPNPYVITLLFKLTSWVQKAT